MSLWKKKLEDLCPYEAAEMVRHGQKTECSYGGGRAQKTAVEYAQSFRAEQWKVSENGWRQQLQGWIAADATEWHTEKGLSLGLIYFILVIKNGRPSCLNIFLAH